MRMYALSLKIEGYPCLVVGGGAIAARKARDLLDCGAQVSIVSPECCETVRRMADDDAVELSSRPFEPDDVQGMRLVIAATNIRSVNEAVTRSARDQGILVNVVDQPDLCDFYVPAKVRRGDLTLAINTGGSFPALSKKLRVALEHQFGPEYADYIQLLEDLRSEIKRDIASHEVRKAVESALLVEPVLDLLAGGRKEEAEERLRTRMREVRDKESG